MTTRRSAVSEIVRMLPSVAEAAGSAPQCAPGRAKLYGFAVGTCTRRVPEMPASDGSPLRYALT